MKARIKKGPSAGREIEVDKFDDWCYRNSKSGKIYQKEELDFSENTTDWDAFRREVAKDMLTFTAQMKLAKEGVVLRMVSKENAVKLAIEYADELIKQLREWKK